MWRPEASVHWLNDAAVTDANASVTEADLRDGAAKLSLGRKRHVLVRLG